MNNKVDIELLLRLQGECETSQELTERYNEITGESRKSGTIRSALSRYNAKMNVEEEIHTSERYQELATTKMVSEEQLLEMHGYDPLLWEIVSSNSTRSKIGTKGNEEQYFVNTYSKITVKKREQKITEETLNEIYESLINHKVKTNIKRVVSKGNGYMLIPAKDMHIKYRDQYRKQQQEYFNWITSQGWKEIKFVIGSDLFNTNDSHGRTYNDTVVDTMESSLIYRMQIAKEFYQPLIDVALEQAMKVEVVYEAGNHDKDTALQFVTALSWLYEDNEHISFDLSEEDYKLLSFDNGNIKVGTHHGNYKSTVKAVAETFHRYFGKEIALSNYVECLIGHKHHRWSGEHMNLFVQGLSTMAEDTDYEKRMGFANGYKAFTLRIYDDYGLKLPVVINGSSID